MTIKRFVATKDNTITNAFKENLVTRATGSNMGASDILEVFSIYAQATTSSVELSRVLMQFPVDTISTQRSESKIPVSGNVSFYLKVSNAPHSLTTPKGYYLTVSAISRSWTEGNGLDMEQYKDLGTSNWISSSNGVAWTAEGGDYHSSPQYAQYFDKGNEDLEVDITSLVEEWLSGDKENYGLAIMLSSSHESEETSYYTKKFFGRGSEFFFKKPYIEARWDSSITDDRQNFYASSSLLDTENLNKLYLYNKFRGTYRNIPSVGTGSIYLSLYSGSLTSGPSGSALTLYNGETKVTGGYAATGKYSASVAIDTSLSYLYDVWHNGETGSGYVEYFTGSVITVNHYTASSDSEIEDYVITMSNMKGLYSANEIAQMRMVARKKDWQPTIYTVAKNEMETNPIKNAYYKVIRVQDSWEIISYGTGSDNHTLMSYDKEGNYFDLDMSSFEPGYSYGIKVSFLQDGEYREQKEMFKFRVE